MGRVGGGAKAAVTSPSTVILSLSNTNMIKGNGRMEGRSERNRIFFFKKKRKKNTKREE